MHAHVHVHSYSYSLGSPTLHPPCRLPLPSFPCTSHISPPPASPPLLPCSPASPPLPSLVDGLWIDGNDEWEWANEREVPEDEGAGEDDAEVPKEEAEEEAEEEVEEGDDRSAAAAGAPLRPRVEESSSKMSTTPEHSSKLSSSRI